MNKFQDIELLSAYLDGQLNPSDSARLESRFASDLELASALDDLRVTRGVLRKLPARKAPRNFMLTRKMVGAKPPMPRAYSFFRFSSAFATLLLVITFALNFIGSRISFGAAAPAFGYGGGECGEPCGNEPALQVPFAGAAATEAPAVTEVPAQEMAPLPTEMPPPASADSARLGETPTPEVASTKQGAAESAPLVPPEVQNEAFVFSPAWQIGLLIVGLVSALIAFVMSQSAKRKWK